MKTQFIPIDYDYFDWQGKNFAKITGRNENGEKICLIDSCPVYLWAILKKDLEEEKLPELIEKIQKIKIQNSKRETTIEKIEIFKKNFLGKEVSALKIFATNYKDLHEIANNLHLPEIEFRRGYDLGYITHYIIESKLKPLGNYEIEGEILNNSLEFGGIDSILDVSQVIKVDKIKNSELKEFFPKVLAYDIETDHFKIGQGEILMVSIFGKNLKKVITTKKILGKKPDYIEYVQSEGELVEKFSELIRKESPDFLVGYFSDGFDLPYLKARAEKNQVELALGIDKSSPTFSRGAMLTGKINGIVHIDLLRFIRTAYAQYMQSETLSLNEVAKEFLGDTKKEFNIPLGIKNENWKEFAEYNLHDSNLTYRLFEKFWTDMKEFTKTVQEPIFDVSRAGLSKYMESYILHNLDKFNEIPEKRPTAEEISTRKQLGGVQGAFVYEPTPGLYENICMFDFTSMHTSIIITYNLSKGTLLNKKENNCFESPEIEENSEKTKYYFSKKLGFFPELLKEIFELRKKFKEEHKKNPNSITKARSNAFKVLSASAHGYIAFFGARYYSHEASASILAFVRKFNMETIKKTEKEGFTPIYGDTDSIAFLRNSKSKEEVKKFLEKLNSELPGVMHLELEDFYSRGLWVTTRSGKTGAKKKYALLDEKGNLKIRGFETVRRDWCPLARETQNKILQKILEDGNEKNALKYVKEIIKKLKERQIPLEKVLIKTQLKKQLSEYKAISPHVVAAKKMKEQKIQTEQGELIQYYIAETKGNTKLVRDRVKLANEKGEYNIKYYLEHQILPAVENIFQIFRINIQELIDGKRQMSLGEF